MSVNTRQELGPVSRWVLFVATLGAATVAPACQHVAPYNRGRLAHPTMTTDRTGLAEAHVYAVHEGAIGGNPGAESGCGCN